MNPRLRGLGTLLAVAVGLLVTTTGIAHAHKLAPRAMVLVDADDFADLRTARTAVEAAGGKVQGMMPPNILMVRLDPEADEALIGVAGITAIERGKIELASGSKSARRLTAKRPSRLAMKAWNQRLRAKSPKATRGPLPAELLGVDVLEAPAGSPADGDGDEPPSGTPGPRSNYDNTKYFAGDCVVTVFLTESDGSLETSTENWTESEETQVTAEIQQGLSWIADYVNTTYNTNVTFIYEWHYREPTKYEPIKTNAAWPAGNAAPYEIMQRYGYSGSTSGGRAFNSAKREQYGADMAYLIFVADSSADGDGYFADGYIAYAYLNGPWIVQNYRNDGWGISRMNQVTAHETGHIFGAGDEYSSSGATASMRFGYLSVLNGNAQNGGAGNSCLMLNNSLTICKWTIGQMGAHLPDTTNDGTPDCFQYDAGGTTRRDQMGYVSHGLDDDTTGASNGNDNGEVEGGETVELACTIQNDSFVKMTGVTGTLSTSSPHVTIVDATATFGDVDYTGGQAATSDRFVFSVSPTAPESTATFTVELETSQGWHFSFQIDVPVSGAPPDGLPPTVPTGLEVTGTGDGWAGLNWNDNTEEDFDHYNVYRSLSAASGYTLIAQPAESAHTDETANNGTTYYYKVSASDETGNESNTCTPVQATLEDEPPEVTIVAPENGLTVAHDEEIDFSATATDREDGTISSLIVWTSSLQGQIGTGASLSRTLDSGTHVITASVTDSGENVDTDTITVTVQAPNGEPVVTITAPASGSSFTIEDTVSFTGAATDAEDGDLTASITWTSSIDGALGTGGSVNRSLSLGTHTITASVTDSAEQTSTDEITVTVTLEPLTAPQGLRVAIRRGAALIRWDANEEDETGYRIERAVDEASPSFSVVAVTTAGKRSHKDRGLGSGAFLYRVRALRDAEVGPACQSVAVRLLKRQRDAVPKEPNTAVPTDAAASEWAKAEFTGEAADTASAEDASPVADDDEQGAPVEAVTVLRGGAEVTIISGGLNSFAALRDHFRKKREAIRRSLRRRIR